MQSSEIGHREMGRSHFEIESRLKLDSGRKRPLAQRFFDQPLLRSVKRKNSDCFATGAASSLSTTIWE